MSIIGLAAEVYICKKIASETGGSYSVATSESHFVELFMSHSNPPPQRESEAVAKLVSMGFPARGLRSEQCVVFVGEDANVCESWYTCPRCKANVVDLPTTCPTCSLTLVSS